MKKIFFTRRLFLFALLLSIPLACSREVISGPQFVFRPSSSTHNEKVAAKIAGKEVLFEELYQGIQGDLFDLEMRMHEIKMRRLTELTLKELMRNDSKAHGLSHDEYLNKYIVKGVKVTEAEINTFVKERKIPQEHINPEMKERIRKYLAGEAKRKGVDRWLAKKTAKSPVEVYFARPKRPFFEIDIEGAPFVGSKGLARVTLVEFSDFECPYCAKGAEMVDELKKKYGKKLKVVFKNFPLATHPHARSAAEAALCVNEQDSKKFWKMRNEMFQDQKKLGKEALFAKAKKVGAKMDQFKACFEKGKYRTHVAQDIEQGIKLGVKSTPTFFINGKLVRGARGMNLFASLIDEEFAK